MFFGLFKDFAHFFKKVFALLVFGGVNVLVKMAEQIFLLFVQAFRDFHLDGDVLIAALAGVELRHALAAQAEYRVRLRSLRNVVRDLAVYGGNLYLGAQRRLDKGDGIVTKDIISLADKQLVVPYPNI